ncbi:Dimethylmenaquinone methyltransferase [Cupriavidus taiwanensis]|uniref:Putative 4-hydroxy-4-methyl-2-oxoglutarate aldolase n=1 Tax=Cupriavidus taiwanensis TaxID=164546 RepID=A0A375E6C5_9BURK|nr:RraA family protein [Cupriavidus taiwanensis]SOY69456.1 Dimethylmenaquinone methyltransferase [Cupriavidus taiwanensis]SOZ62033.1 Dimethylmenaquinone methyltransferase [Cupriavidus taiwanensis]SOZ62259.1 Dimethylmenaquinone methyltransferase [Cupriavidus taiwanensis]SOZ66293.1 Dimethylmenaquinone methyltransferase [Cupriavidus taiwanensis]SPA07512.1 Dimethylmenaquinone methyltransferase [Cupriavidus taiwanensis]
MSTPQEYVRRLRRLDCCAVSDTLDKLGLPGVVSGVRQEAGDGRIAGRVITVKLGTGAPPPGEPRHLGTTAIEAGGADDVIVVEQRTGIEAGSWGGMLSLGAKVKGIAGVVADGPVRDIDEARAMNFPIFTSSLTARTARGRIVEKGTNVPIRVWDVDVNAGDYVLADRSAVIFIAAANIDRVLEAAEGIVAREARMAKAVLAGTPMSQVMGGNYEFMLKD